MMYIAIENMASAFGDKSKNTYTGLRRKVPQADKQAQYEKRIALAKAVGFDRHDHAEGDVLSAAKDFAAKNPDECRFGVSGSLSSMLKRVQVARNGGLKFDTLVFVGHGTGGSMTVGMGCMPPTFVQPKNQDSKKEQHKKGKKITTRETETRKTLNHNPGEIVEDMELERRGINVDNEDTWLSLFKKADECFSTDHNGTFHVVFAGCSTANAGDRTNRVLTEVVADALANLFGCTVTAYGMTKPMTNKEVYKVLGEIKTITENATGSGSIPLNFTEDTKDTLAKDERIRLRWVTKVPPPGSVRRR